MYNVLPFYTSVDQQNHRKAWCHGDVCQWKLITPPNRLPPFQIQRAYSVEGISSIELVCYDQVGAGTETIALINPLDLTIENADNVDWITYFANFDLSSDLDCGAYYLIVTDGDGTKWYSEVFNVVDFTDDSTTMYRKVYDFETPIRTTDDGTDSRIVN